MVSEETEEQGIKHSIGFLAILLLLVLPSGNLLLDTHTEAGMPADRESPEGGVRQGSGWQVATGPGSDLKPLLKTDQLSNKDPEVRRKWAL